ncbi:PREDICTED: NADH dehydrogenase [ubiquinone] 1 beta subcomplex subunit 11, mitochondrial [Polistes dominula]|uniref:NADH dehydrogenase [ubiquinone] 1 beta subcomplex subunit 11, mitochondrial n=1 Tax=Polistes dominula TaxID=743375 RepID=A0ABM1IVB0_POLDO|nr:PREDICTED: NADH dehydrogenase [ubiquinone] 1 beta subcomplex subunit 11, mitochondrial [Polistes dominula]XP_015184059.1 PREDICTED: NADH dehydrogenase [ubiquinone] 1 beta subcomplex subunit 11, mitochondrial [Polistes dominula]XP_015184147.1 PREDICTED: NADH dehydrogenase [ubiquinone] 1 beta subcomplex subunit 11, mitochondrial [Polistes dominula]
MAGICRLSALNTLRRSGMNFLKSQNMLCRSIATSPKKNDSTTSLVESTTEKKKPWVSYGFDEEDELDDKRKMHESFFFAVTIGMICVSYVLMYKPDLKSMGSWAQREAYLQIRYREEHGLPLIDMNVVDPAKVILPTDEELGDTEIII